MLRISLLVGLILIGKGLCQVFEGQEISSDDDLMASAATLFGPKTFGIRHANLGNFGPLGYGGIGGMRMGSIGPLHYGHIGGIHADSFLGASNPNAGEDESPGGTGTPPGWSQDIVGNSNEQNWRSIDGQENIVRMQQNWEALDDQANNVGMEQNWQGIDGQENIVGMEQNWQGFAGPENFVGMEQNWQGIDGQENIVGMEQNWQGFAGPENFVGMEQNWQGIDGQENIVGMEQNWQGFAGPENFLGMEQNWQGINGQQSNMYPNEQGAWELGLQPQVPENSRAFLNDGLFGVKADKVDKFEKIPPKPAPPPKFPKHPPKFTPPPPPPPNRPPPPTPPPYNYYGGYGSNSHGHGSHSPGSSYTSAYRRYGGSHGLHSHSNLHSQSSGFNKYGKLHGHGSLHGHKNGFNSFGSHSLHSLGGNSGLLFRNDDVQQFQRNAPQAYELTDQFQQFYEINNAMPVPTTTTYYQPNIILIEQFPQLRQSSSSARSSVDDMLTGLEETGFDFEFRDLIEDVFLTPYLGLLDPYDLDDETVLLL